MSETFFIADPHFDHESIRVHCKRPYSTLEEMNEGMASVWNGIVGSKDLVYIAGDFAFKNHRRWVSMLHGKKILIVGNHDKMPQDTLDLFKPDWACEDVKVMDAIKTMAQFREVHQLLERKICGHWMTICHYPMRSWSGSVHGSWCICGHAHGRCKVALPGEAAGGLILDVGWDVFGKPIPIETLEREMRVKFDKMPQNFREHVLLGKPLRASGETGENPEGDDNDRPERAHGKSGQVYQGF